MIRSPRASARGSVRRPVAGTSGRLVTSRTGDAAPSRARSTPRRRYAHARCRCAPGHQLLDSPALRLSLSGLMVALAIGIHSAPTDVSGSTSVRLSPAMIARAPACSNAWAVLNAYGPLHRGPSPARSAGSSRRPGSAAGPRARQIRAHATSQHCSGTARTHAQLPLAFGGGLRRNTATGNSDAIGYQARRMGNSCLKSSTGNRRGVAHRLPCVRARAPRPGCSGWAASNPTCRAPRPRRSTAGPAATAAPASRFDYSGHGESGGDLHRRHDRPLAGGECGGVSRLCARAAGRGRLVHGRMARAAAGARAGAAGQRRRPPRSRAWC